LLSELSDTARAAINQQRASAIAPSMAFESALRHTDGEQRFVLLQAAFGRLVIENPTRAFTQLDRLPADQREAIASVSLAQWAKRAPEQAMQHLKQSVDLPPAYHAAVLSAVAEHDLQRALEWLQDNQYSQAPELHRAILPSLIQADINVAARTVADLQERAPIDLIQQVAVEYAKQDPQLAYAWVTNATAQQTEHGIVQTMQAVSNSLAASDPAAAIAFLERTTDARIKSSLLHGIASYKAQQNVRSGWEWLNQYRSEASYRENERSLLSQWSYAKPEEVADVVMSIDDIDFQRAAAEQLAGVWQQRDRAAFRNWVATLPPGMLKQSLLAFDG
jgi:hypothetical protein